MGYHLRAARLGVESKSVTVEIEADSNVVGMLSTEASEMHRVRRPSAVA